MAVTKSFFRVNEASGQIFQPIETSSGAVSAWPSQPSNSYIFIINSHLQQSSGACWHALHP